MISAPDLNLAVLLPIVLVAIGSLATLMGAVLLSRADTVLGREVTESFIGTVLAATAIFFFALTLYASGWRSPAAVYRSSTPTIRCTSSTPSLRS